MCKSRLIEFHSKNPSFLNICSRTGIERLPLEPETQVMPKKSPNQEKLAEFSFAKVL